MNLYLVNKQHNWCESIQKSLEIWCESIQKSLEIWCNTFVMYFLVLAKISNTKSSKIIMAHPKHYGETRLIKFGDYNIGFENNILTLPYYLAFALSK